MKAILTTILLASAIWTLPAQTRADSLYNELQRQGVPYALEWMQVAYAETTYQGKRLNSWLATHHHNYFGLGVVQGCTYVVPGWQRPDGTWEPAKSGFANMQACVAAIKRRTLRWPYRFGESPYAYLVRTGYNPRGWAYADYVRRVNVADLIK